LHNNDCNGWRVVTLVSCVREVWSSTVQNIIGRPNLAPYI